MQRIERDITEEQYKMLLNMSVNQANDYIEEIACHSGCHPAGYGFYRSDFYCKGNGYAVSWWCGDSCD